MSGCERSRFPTRSKEFRRLLGGLLGLWVGITGGAGVSSAAPERFDELDPPITQGAETVWLIRRPNPLNRLTLYPAIRLQPGDRVTIDAGGEVRSGKPGSKRAPYLGEAGEGKLPGALLWLPGGTSRLLPLRDHVGREFTLLPSTPPEEAYLRLGFDWGGIPAGGYRNVQNPAWVRVTVRSGSGSASEPRGPLDLVWSELDDNLFPREPKWRWQEDHPEQALDPDAFPNPLQSPPNTYQRPQLDEAEGFHAFICRTFFHPQGGVLGHINWAPATFRGTLSWFQHATDGDYHLYLKPRNAAGKPILNGLTRGNAGEFVAEFDSNETVFYFRTPWWKRLRQAVDTDDAATHAMLDGRDTVISGLFGLDAEHKRHSELHPVWTFAIHAEDPAPKEELWSVFARNWGNEGYCSSHQHYVDTPGNRMSILLPWRPNATGVRVRQAEFAGIGVRSAEPEVTVRPGVGVLLTFQLAAPKEQSSVHGECRLVWSGAPQPAAAPPSRAVASALPSPAQARPHESGEPDDAEDYVRGLIKGLSPEQRQRYLANLAESPAETRPVERRFQARWLEARRLAVLPSRAAFREAVPATNPPHAPIRAVPDLAKRERDRRRIEALREALGGSLPVPKKAH